jgi:TolA-binding protein
MAALALFQQAYETTEMGSRAEVVSELERLYREIIDRYPRAALAQEAYLRLVIICLKDYSPPAFDKAEELHRRFIALYPASQFRTEIEDTLTDNYTRNGQWERLLRMYTPAVRKYIETGKLAKPRDMFLYAEAKYRLNDLVEAEKGYRIVIALFPRTRESSLAAERLDEIKGKKQTK